MVLYECKLCNYSSKIKTQYKRHLETKKHQRNLKDSLLEKHNEHKMSKNEHKMSKNEQKKYICTFCPKSFSTHANKRRHELHYCYNADSSKDLKKMNSLQIRENKELKKQIEILLNKVGNTTNYNSTINNTIVLNNYGEEDMSHITDSLKTKLLKVPFGMIPKMIEHVHFKKPENKNIMITNSRDNKLKIFKDNKWVYKDKAQALNDLVDNNYFMLDNYFETTMLKLDEIQKENYKKFRNLVNTGDKALIENIKRDCELLLLNNR